MVREGQLQYLPTLQLLRQCPVEDECLCLAQIQIHHVLKRALLLEPLDSGIGDIFEAHSQARSS